MRTYHVFYNGQKRELQAESSYAAQQGAVVLMKVPAKKRHMISVVLADVPVDTAGL